MPDRLLELQDTEVSPQAPAPAVRSGYRSPLLQRQMPGLDILRGLAVLAVYCYHGLSWYQPLRLGFTPGAERIIHLFQPGWTGVNLFFVLSGFLITGILLDTRTRANYWQSFYVRRVLRILPLYLVVLALAAYLFDLRPFYILLCLLYAANLSGYFPGIHDMYGPLWSLAVEEQFYLVWPLLVRRLRLRVLGLLCVGIIVASPVLRYLAVARFAWLGDPYTVTWLIADNLAWGALVAVLLRTPLATAARVRNATWGLAVCSVAGGVWLWATHNFSRASATGAALQTVPLLLLFTAMLLWALRFGGNASVLRLSAPLRFFGYISYGLYLLHVAFFRLYDDVYVTLFGRQLRVLTAGSILTRFAVTTVVGCGVCYLSRRYFEERFLLLKDRLVPYSKPSPQ